MPNNGNSSPPSLTNSFKPWSFTAIEKAKTQQPELAATIPFKDKGQILAGSLSQECYLQAHKTSKQDYACSDDEDWGDWGDPSDTDQNQIIDYDVTTVQGILMTWTLVLEKINSGFVEEQLVFPPRNIHSLVIGEEPQYIRLGWTWTEILQTSQVDTGLAKVKWHYSEIEKLHLQALNHQRGPTETETSSLLDMDADIDDAGEFALPIEYNIRPQKEKKAVKDDKNKRPKSFTIGFGSSFANLFPRRSGALSAFPILDTKRSHNASVTDECSLKHDHPARPSNPTNASISALPNSQIPNLSEQLFTETTHTPSKIPPAYAKRRPEPIHTLTLVTSADMLDFTDSLIVKSPTNMTLSHMLTPLVPSPVTPIPSVKTLSHERRHTMPEGTLNSWMDLNLPKPSGRPINLSILSSEPPDEDFGDFTSGDANDGAWNS